MTIRKFLIAAGIASSLLAGTVLAGDCYSERVEGCGKKARVCVNTSSSSEAETKAKEWFKKTHNCQSPTVNSYSSSCSEAANDKCDAKL
jgi:hypothetical protein